MYAKIKNNIVEKYPYNFTDLQTDNPLTSFGTFDVFLAFQDTEEFANGAALVSVIAVSQPSYDIKTQILREITPEVISTGEYEQRWEVVEKYETPELKATAIAAELATAKTNFTRQVKSDAGAITQQFLQGLESEYDLAEKEATAFKAAGYPEPTSEAPLPGSIQDEIASKAARGITITATVACNNIIIASTGWRNAQAELRRKRLTVASETYSAVDFSELDEIKTQWQTFMTNLYTMLGIPQSGYPLSSQVNGIIPVTTL